jgi:hypothetical protein
MPPLSSSFAAIRRLATPGKNWSYTAKKAGIIKLARAFYGAANDTVALTPKKPFTLTSRSSSR